MALTKGPLFSMQARGAFGKSIIYRKSNFVDNAKAYAEPIYRRSPNQDIIRSAFAYANSVYHSGQLDTSILPWYIQRQKFEKFKYSLRLWFIKKYLSFTAQSGKVAYMTRIELFQPWYNYFILFFWTSEFSSSYKIELRDFMGILRYTFYSSVTNPQNRYTTGLVVNISPGFYYVDIYHKTGSNYLIAGQWFGQFIKH